MQDLIPVLMPLHITFMALAVVLVITGTLVARGRKPGWLKKHKRFTVAGAASALVGLLMMVLFKNILQYPHFHSPHAIGGAVVLVLLVAMLLLGAFMAGKPGALWTTHRVMGRITAALLLLAALSGVARFIQISNK